MVEFVFVWNVFVDLWFKLVNLKVVFFFGVGVDSIDLMKIVVYVFVVRIVDDNLVNDMVEYVLIYVLVYKFRFKEYYLK